MRLTTRIITTTLVCLFFSLVGKAQNAQETSVRYNKKNNTGVTAKYKATAKETEGALLKRLEAAGLNKKKKKNGFYVYRSVTWNEIMPEKTDVYVKVSGNKKNAVAEIMIAKGYDNYITAASDPEAVEKLKNVLNNLPADIDEYRKAQALAAKEAAVAQAQKDLAKADQQAARTAKRHERELARRARKQASLEEKQKQLSKIKQ